MKYAAAGIVVVAGGAAGAYYATRPSGPGTTATTAITTVPTTPALPPEKKNTLVVGRLFDAVSLDPQWTFEVTAVSINSQVYDTLVRYDLEKLAEEKYVYAPSLAKSWDVSSDKLEWTFHLRDDAKFYPSGNPVDAEAVKFTFERSPKLQGPPSFMFGAVKNTEALDNYTVKVTLNYAWGAWLGFLAGQYASIIDPTVMEQDVDGDMGSAWLNDHSAGSGAFYLDHWTREKEFLLLKNPNHWGEPAKVDKVLILAVPEVSVQQMMVEKGDIDIAVSLTPDQAQTYEETGRTDVVVKRPLSFWMCLMYMNCNTKPIDDVMVRQAIKYSIDCDKALKEVARGNGRVVQTFLQYGMPYYDEELADYYKRDVTKAKSLLADAGYSEGITIPLNIAGGVNASTRWEDLALLMKNDMVEAGINLDIRLWDMSALVSQVFEGKSPGLSFVPNIADWPDPDEYCELTLGPTARGWVNWNPGKQREQEIDALWMAARTELDEGKRKELYRQAALVMLNESPYHILYQPNELLVMSSHVKGFVYNSFAFAPMYRYIYKE